MKRVRFNRSVAVACIVLGLVLCVLLMSVVPAYAAKTTTKAQRETLQATEPTVLAEQDYQEVISIDMESDDASLVEVVETADELNEELPFAPENRETVEPENEVNHTNTNAGEFVFAIAAVNVRSGPGTDFEKIGMINAGEKVERIGQAENGWSKVLFNGNEAYVSDNYLSDMLQAAHSGNAASGDDVDSVTLDSFVVDPNSPVISMPHYFQTDYYDVPYGSYGSVATHGCGVTSLAMVATYLLGENCMPDEMADLFGDYNTEVGSKWSLFGDSARVLGLNLDRQTNDIDTVYHALENNCVVIARCGPNSIFTDGGHFIVLAGITLDGKVLVNDPSRFNYSETARTELKDGFTYGFEKEDFSGCAPFWIYAPKENSSPVDRVETVFAVSAVNVRSGPGAQFEKLGTLHTGDSVQRLRVYGNGWSKVFFDGKVGYVSTNYLTSRMYAAGRYYFDRDAICSMISSTTGVPHYFQTDYPDMTFGAYGSVSEYGSGVMSLAMVASYYLGEIYTPEMLIEQFGDYNTDIGQKWSMFEDSAEVLGLEISKQTNKLDLVLEALENGSLVIARCGSESIFTKGGHFVVFTGITSDGKVLVNDPYDGNYSSVSHPRLKNGFANGFDRSDFYGCGPYWIYTPKDE